MVSNIFVRLLWTVLLHAITVHCKVFVIDSQGGGADLAQKQSIYRDAAVPVEVVAVDNSSDRKVLRDYSHNNKQGGRILYDFDFDDAHKLPAKKGIGRALMGDLKEQHLEEILFLQPSWCYSWNSEVPPGT